MVKVKICGLTRQCDIQWANEVRPDYVGFVFAGTRRRLTALQADGLRQALAPAIPAVGVFVDAPVETIAGLASQQIIQLVQLHGHEDEAYIKKLRLRTNIPIIQAFSITSANDAERAVRSTADYILTDQGAGGTGKVFDWSYITSIQRPYFLAGGLTVENVAAAIRLCPYALDVSSGVETDGVKDKIKIIKFMAQVRATSVHEEETE